MIDVLAVIAAISGTGIVGAAYKVYADRAKKVDATLLTIKTEHKNCTTALEASRVELNDLRLRVVVLELKNDIGFPTWRKTQEGRYLWANPEYVRRVLAPLHMNVNSIYGKTDGEVLEFTPSLRDIFAGLDAEAAARGFAIARGVEFHPGPGGMMTVLKRVATDELGGITFIGIACPEY